MSSQKYEENLYKKIITFVHPTLPQEEIQKMPANLLYSKLLEHFVHINLGENEAKEHWQNILENAEFLEKKLKKTISPHLAIIDHFVNNENFLKSPYLVEIQVFQKAEKFAMIDPLTGSFNRRYLDLVLQKEINRSERYGKVFSLTIFDIDDFKKINDTYGHIAGDEVLQFFSSHIKELMREEDILCRFGGEEFLIILPETDMEGALLFYNRVRSCFKKKTVLDNVHINFSAGIASFPECGKDSVSLIRQADKALYEAKYSGKDKCALAEKTIIPKNTY